jgi:predicted ATPase/DNA-binding CsgD family transcriptional regulator
MPMTGRADIGRLPVEVTSFVGRRQQLGEIKRLLSESRLVTLTGVGGAGKTRIALRLAAEVRRAFGDGVWFVDLTQLDGLGLLAQEVHDPDVLAYLVGATMGLRQQGGGQPLQWLAGQLAGRQMLMILDNCEHLIPASAILANTLLRECPGLRVLATSREPLAMTGEALFAVPPLPAPDPGHQLSLADLGRCEAVALFLARAEAAVPGFGLTEENQGAVADLCHRLDGLPLAIELAASRVRVLTPQQILDRLADRFTLLSHGSRSAPERQQTLRACVDWSFDLCAKPEQVLWSRLSVFVGAFELDAVEGVCADECLPQADLLDLVAGLVDKSILVRDDQDGGAARYRMLETLRDYGRDKLDRAGEHAEARRRHRDWYQWLAAAAQAEWISDRQPYWLARLGREHANLRAAIEYCLADSEEAEAALGLLTTLPRTYWWVWGWLGEARQWLQRGLAHRGVNVPTALRVRALTLALLLELFHGDLSAADQLLDEAHGLAQTVSPHDLDRLVVYRGMVALFHGDLPAARDLLEHALTIVSNRPQLGVDLRLTVLISLGNAAELSGDRVRAEECGQEVLALTEPCGEIYYRAQGLWLLAVVAWRQGRLTEATTRAQDSLRLRRTSGMRDGYNIAVCLEQLAWIAARQSQYLRAAALLGAADGALRDLGVPIAASLVRDHEECLQQTRGVLGDGALTAAFTRGRSLPMEAALDYALDERSEPEPAPAQSATTPLTRREQQVADLISEGLSNQEIATRLVISQRTAESHVEHILTKLGFTSRARVAAWIAAQQVNDQELE